MRSRHTIRIVFAALPLLAMFTLFAQQANREPYRTAYRNWRLAEPDLERDAATPNEALAGRTTHAASEAAGFGAARAAFLRQFADDESQNALWLKNVQSLSLPDFAPVSDLQRLVAAGTANVNTTIATFSVDTDRGIQQLRQALEHERTALAALDASILERQKAVEKAAQAEIVFEPARAKALSEYSGMTEMLLTPSAALVDQETAAWAKYYSSLASPRQTPATVSSISPAGASSTPSAAIIPSAPRPGMPPLPLTRYTGVWVYPTVNGRFFGAEPDFVDFTVHEDSGHVTGEFYARFKLPPGSTGDPVLRFDLSGNLSEKRVQSFAIQTTEGVKGTIELIPGNALNLLEINFQTEPSPGKVRAADLVLVKK